MKQHTTNYKNTFIEVAEDCKVNKGEVPPIKEQKKTVAKLQFEMLCSNPYKYTSDDVLFDVFSKRRCFSDEEKAAERTLYFSKGQPCFRASPLTKKYGWGIHSNAEGKIALYGMETNEYKSFLTDDAVKKVKAMRTTKK